LHAAGATSTAAINTTRNVFAVMVATRYRGCADSAGRRRGFAAADGGPGGRCDRARPERILAARPPCRPAS
jgi:hypothetical protein